MRVQNVDKAGDLQQRGLFLAELAKPGPVVPEDRWDILGLTSTTKVHEHSRGRVAGTDDFLPITLPPDIKVLFYAKRNTLWYAEGTHGDDTWVSGFAVGPQRSGG